MQSSLLALGLRPKGLIMQSISILNWTELFSGALS